MDRKKFRKVREEVFFSTEFTRLRNAILLLLDLIEDEDVKREKIITEVRKLWEKP